MEYKILWNPWHGCKKLSIGCMNCYAFRKDAAKGVDPESIYLTDQFELPVEKDENGEYLVPEHSDVLVCTLSDFFIEEADQWREKVWEMIRKRSDVSFSILTKRVDRIASCLPRDWGDGYTNVSLGCSIENQLQCDKRMPIFNSVKCKSRYLICEPLLDEIDLTEYFTPDLEYVLCSGERGKDARVCKMEWVEYIRDQCLVNTVRFIFEKTGSRFEKDGKVYKIPLSLQREQAKKSKIQLF